MAIIIAGFATCGKSVLGRKYKNVIDLESSPFKHKWIDTNLTTEQLKGTKREINEEWPQNYYEAIKEACKKYDIVLVQLKPEHFDYFDENHIRYSIAYPNINNWNIVEKRCIERGNNETFITRLKQVFKPYYNDSLKRKYEKMYILNDNQILEDLLINDNIKLVK